MHCHVTPGSGIAKQQEIASGIMGASGRVKGGVCVKFALQLRFKQTNLKGYRNRQQVPGIVLLYCIGRTYSNVYLINFKVGHFRAHTHLLHCWNCWKHREASFGVFMSSSVAFHLTSSMIVKRVLLRPILGVGNSQKSLGARFGEYGAWVMTGKLFCEKNCCTTSGVWLGALS
jgi:hypothetical protein